MSKPTSLTATLKALIDQSIADGRAHSATLARGLTVQVHAQSTKFTLRTWRVNQRTNEQEWQTCFDYLPTNYRTATRPTPMPVHENGAQAYSASWPAPLKLL